MAKATDLESKEESHSFCYLHVLCWFVISGVIARGRLGFDPRPRSRFVGHWHFSIPRDLESAWIGGKDKKAKGFSANNRQSWADHFLSSAQERRGRSGRVAFLEAISRERAFKVVERGRFKIERKSYTEAVYCRDGRYVQPCLSLPIVGSLDGGGVWWVWNPRVNLYFLRIESLSSEEQLKLKAQTTTVLKVNFFFCIC